MNDLDELKRLGQELPVHQPSDEAREALRTSILLAAENQQIADRGRSFRPWLAAVGVCAAAAAALFLWSSQKTESSEQPTLHLVATSADYSQSTEEDARGQIVEVLQLRRGTLDIKASESKSDKVQVRVGNATINGEGTDFIVAATETGLSVVRVRSGQVQVRIANQPAVIIGAGQEWSKAQYVEESVIALEGPGKESEIANPLETRADPSETEPGAAAPPMTAPPVTAPPVTAPPVTAPPVTAVPASEKNFAADRSPKTATTAPKPSLPSQASAQKSAVASVPDPNAALPAAEPAMQDALESRLPGGSTSHKASASEVAFARGYAALKLGNYNQAVGEFEIAIASNPRDAVVVDARYWRALALAKLERGASARSAMIEFLEKHPRSSRRGEVSVMLGWQLVAAGQAKQAASYFKSALDDRNSKVRESAKRGLQSL